jgi:signal transduction histidine kinase
VLNAYSELHALKDDKNFKSSLDKIKNLKDEIDVSYVQSEIENLIAGIEEGAERTAEIVRGLRTFSRIDEASLKTVNVHDGILSTIVLLKNTIPYYIKVVKEFNAEGVIECFPGKLNQVFMNIITNAIQAIKQKPVKEDELITIATRDTAEGCIEISIKDSGPGMDEATKHRIFEPFFTTKDVGEGTGLGMAIVFKIIQKHFGKINIHSSPGNGAEFIITLPHKYKGDD